MRPESLLLKLVDFGLAGAIFAVPLLMGGRQPLGHFVLVAVALVAAVSWCLRQGLAREAAWRRTPLDWLLLAAPVLVGIQLVTLPPWLVEAISGHLYETLPLWAPHDAGTASLGVWNTLSLAPADTRRSLAIVVAMVLLAAVTLQRVRCMEDVERLVRWVACSALAVAVFGLVQFFTSNGKFFWFYEHREAVTDVAVNGPFANPNHFAQFLALGIGPLIWWMQAARHGCHGRRHARWPEFQRAPGSIDTRAGLTAIALAVLMFAGLMSRSRGGAIVIVAAAATCLLFLFLGGSIRPRTLLAGVGVGGLVVAGLFVHGYEPVAEELADLGSFNTLDHRSIRQHLWAADLRAFADYPLGGTGAGSHLDVNPVYLRDESMGRIDYTHAENGYVQIALEAGMPGVLLMLATMGTILWCTIATLRRPLSPRAVTVLAALAASLAASFMHSMVDFVWYVPGCMVVVVILGACLCRVWQFAGREDEESRRQSWASRTAWLAAAGSLVVVGGVLLSERLAAVRAEPAWHRYELVERKIHGESLRDLPPERLQAMADNLNETLRWMPDRGRAHAHLAEVYLGMAEQDDAVVIQGGLRGLRDAALASNFSSPAALREWLQRAFPTSWQHLEAAWQQARLAARCAPLEGRAYLFLADVAFFDGPRSPGKEGYLAQAMRVRPYDGTVLFEAGREALLAGDSDEAFRRWQESYRTGPTAQARLEEFLAGVAPAATFIEVFQPDLAALARMSRLYAERQMPPEEVRVVLQHYAAALEDEAQTTEGTKAADVWRATAGVYRKLDNAAESVRCLRAAVAADPGHLKARRTLGEQLLEAGEFAEAEENLRWCVQWSPNDKKLRKELEAAVDSRLRLGSRPDESPRR